MIMVKRLELQVLVSVITAYIVFGDKLSSRVSVAIMSHTALQS